MTALFQLLVFKADFNALDAEEGRYVIVGRTGGVTPELDERVWLQDYEGNECYGRVAAVRERTILVEPDWDTWTHATARVAAPSIRRFGLLDAPVTA
ncbi:MAG: hypothetical protein QOJ29_2641 [Thermoleophilaceae bacterium]|jgi:hypothetical protein|nr:hypothetical protein [Thermoleophilaceae bacterium]